MWEEEDLKVRRLLYLTRYSVQDLYDEELAENGLSSFPSQSLILTQKGEDALEAAEARTRTHAPDVILVRTRVHPPLSGLPMMNPDWSCHERTQG